MRRETHSAISSKRGGLLLLVGAATASMAAAATVNSSSVLDNFPQSNGFVFPSDETADWLLVGNSPGSVGTTVSVNSGFELGAHLPTDGIPSTQNPSLSGVTKPTGAIDPSIGIGLNGDTALTHTTGKFNFQTIDGEGLLSGTTGRSGVYGDTGVQCSQSTGPCIDGNDNNFYSSTATFPMPNTPLSTSNGILGGNSTTLQALRDALDSAETEIPLLPSGGTLTGGSFSSDLTIILDDPGIHVLDVLNPGSDWDLGNFDIVVDGPAESFLIVRIPNGVNMLSSNSWIGIGGSGIGLNNVLFYTDQSNNNAHFSFQNTLFNGVAIWDLSDQGADLEVDNGQGCAQFIGDQIVMNDVRFNFCGSDPESRINPEPGSGLLLFVGAGVMLLRLRKS